MDEVHFGAHGPRRPGRRLAHGLQDVLGRAAVVGRLHHVEGHFGMHDHLDARVFGADLRDLLRGEAHVHRAVAFPQDQLRALELVAREPAERRVGIPHHHLVECHAHLEGGVAAEVLVGQEEDLFLLLPPPLQRGGGVRRSADGAAVLPDQRLYRRGGVDVGHRHRAPFDFAQGRRREAQLLQLAPADLELIRGRHVGHGTASGKVRQDHALVRQCQDVGTLGHEVDAAKHDVVGTGMLRDRAGELERIAGVIGEANHFIALVVVAEDHEAVAERGAGGGNAQRHLLVGQPEVGLRQRLALVDGCLLDVVEDRQERARRHSVSDPVGRAGLRACESFRNLRARKDQTPLAAIAWVKFGLPTV